MSDFVVDPGELSKSFGGKPREEKQAKAPTESKAASGSTSDVPSILQKEYTRLRDDLESYKTKLNEAIDPGYRAELMARIPRAERDLQSLSLEIARVGGAVPEAVASGSETQTDSGGFKVDPGELGNSFKEKTAGQKDLNLNLNNLRTMGSAKPNTANFLADIANGLDPGTTAKIRAIIANKNPALEASRSLAQEILPPAETIPGHERWLAPRSAQPIPKALSDEMITMTGGADVPGSGENVLAKNTAAVQKLNELGHNPANMSTSGDLLLTEPSRARPSTPNVWKIRGIGPAPWMGANRTASPASVAATAPSSAPVNKFNIDELASRIQNANKISSPLELLGKVLHYGGAGLGAYDTLLRSGALSRQGEESETDIPGAIISGLGTVAQLASPYVPAVGGAIAGPLTAAALPVAATVAPLINMARDRVKHLSRHPEEQQLPPVVNGITYGPMGEPYR